LNAGNPVFTEMTMENSSRSPTLPSQWKGRQQQF
jgi:hypothetical protein